MNFKTVALRQAATRVLAALLIGLLFGTGILVSGMANPAKVLNFFDVAQIWAGTWDASLAFVMAGALAVTTVGYRLVLGGVLGRSRPVFEPAFDLPRATSIDVPLVTGSAVFGIGWGIGGFCPGGLIPVLAIGRPEPILFLAGLIAGLVVAKSVRLRAAGGAPMPAVPRQPDPANRGAHS